MSPEDREIDLLSLLKNGNGLVVRIEMANIIVSFFIHYQITRCCFFGIIVHLMLINQWYMPQDFRLHVPYWQQF